MTTVQPKSALARRFRGFIDPTPMALHTFEALRKPHVVALNLEPPVAPAQEAAPIVAEAPAQSPATAPVAAAKPGPHRAAASLLRSRRWSLHRRKSKRVTLPDPAPAKSEPVAAANASPAPQAFFSVAPPQPDQPPSSGFPVHQLVIALCGALGVAGALRFVVGA